MKKTLIKILSITLSFVFVIEANAAVIIKKEDAYQYSRKSDYAIELDTGRISEGFGESTSGSSNQSDVNEDSLAQRFVCPTAQKDGDTYTNTWSNYTLTIDSDDKVKQAVEFYDFNNQDCKYDFGLVWPDFSRLAVYYTRLSRDLNTIAKTFSKNFSPRNVTIAGEVYKYVQEVIEYPYGKEYYDYYLRNVDGKLMIIECFHEDDDDMATEYIEQFERFN